MLGRASEMELRKFSLDQYKGYAEPTEVELAPLTILVGANNSGKTALAQAIGLLAGGLASADQDLSEPLPLEAGGIRHGMTFRDLVTGRSVHGWLRLSATFLNDGRECSLDATVWNVEASGKPPRREISKWTLRYDADEVALSKQGFDERSPYEVHVSGVERPPLQVAWRGLLPEQPGILEDWVEEVATDLRAWTAGVRHLRCPRRLPDGPFPLPERSPGHLGPHGENAALALAAEDGLREEVSDWCRSVFGVEIDVRKAGEYFDLDVRVPSSGTAVRLEQSGRGLSHVLPVAVTALTAGNAGSGVDVIEHPEAELHPAAHAAVADLLICRRAGSVRPVIVETHSEMVLLRARRWIAEGKLPADDVLLYWVDREPDRGSVLKKIRINERGEVDDWPEGVFIEDYEEILAIRRANRPRDSRE